MDSSAGFVHRAFGLIIATLMLLSFLFSPVDLVLAINGMHTRVLDYFFVFITNLGDGIFLVPLALILCLRNLYLSVGLVIAGILEGIVVSLCKRVLFPIAARPMAVIDEALVYLVPGVNVHKAMTFPSGHTVTIFGLCMFLALVCRSNVLSVVLLVVATLVGISRVYLLQHFVNDVAAGALIGSVVGAAVFHWIERTNKPHWMNQRIQITFKLTSTKTKSVSQ